MLRTHGRTLFTAIAVTLFGIPAAFAAPGQPDPSFGDGGYKFLDFSYDKPVDLRVGSLSLGYAVAVGTFPNTSYQQGATKQLVVAVVSGNAEPQEAGGGLSWIGSEDGLSFDCDPLGAALLNTGQPVVACLDPQGTLALVQVSANSTHWYRTEYLQSLYGPDVVVRGLTDGGSNRLLLFGSYTDPAGDRRVFVHRYHADLQLDTAFGGGTGRATAGIAGRHFEAHAATPALFSGDKVYVAGSASTPANGTDLMGLRFLGSGELDTTFGETGIVTLDHAGLDDVAMAIAPHGHHAVHFIGRVGNLNASGQDAGRVVIWKVSELGEPWAGFGQGTGKLVFEMPFAASGDSDATPIVASFDGYSLFVGARVRRAGGTDTDFGLARVLYWGEMDFSFGNCQNGVCGTVVGPGSAGTEWLLAATNLGGQSLAIGRDSVSGAGTKLLVSRYGSSGLPDLTFGVNGIAQYTREVVPQVVLEDIQQQPDGKILAVGRVEQKSRVMRLHPDGAVDISFGTNGSAVLDNPFMITVGTQADGKVIVAGDSFGSKAYRLMPDGTPDASWQGGGYALFPANSGLVAMAVQSDGRIVGLSYRYAAGGASRMAVSRLHADGALDVGFGNGGETVIEPPAGLSTTYGSAVKLLPDGRILVAGTAGSVYPEPMQSRMAVVRLLANGQLDTSWAGSGMATPNIGSLASASDVVIASDGKVYAIGSCRENPNTCVARFLPGGDLDTSYGVAGLAEHDITSYDRGIAGGLDPEGRLVIAAQNQSLSSYTMALRLLPNGQMDPGYQPGPANATLSTWVANALVQANGSLLIGGSDNLFWGFVRVEGGGALDTTAPETAIDSGPSGSVSSAAASFTFSANEPATFECKFDGEAFAACTSPASRSGLAEGSHTFEVRARDAAGNQDATPATRTWTVDATAPQTTINTAPSGTVTSRDASITFSSDEGGSFECRLDGAAFAPCASPATYSGLADGAHAFEVRARDAAGNVDASPATASWTIDATAPDTNLSLTPADAFTTATSFSATLTSEAGATFECRLDAEPFAACTSPVNRSGLANGSHTFEVKARDAAGNVDATPASRTWTIDNVAPDTSISGGPSGTVASNSASFTLGSTESPVTFECRLDGGAWGACSASPSYSELAEGAHAFEARSKDAAGNTDATPASRTWTVDTVAPETNVTGGPAGTVATGSAAITFSSNDAGATFQCRLDGGAFAPCTSPVNFSGLADGLHSFEVRAVDGAGNTDATPASRSWTVDTTAPDSTIDSAPSGSISSTGATITFSSEAGASFECKLDSGAFAACTSPQVPSGLSQGAHTFQVRARDAVGNIDATPATVTWTVDTTVPTTTIDSGPSGGNNNNPVSFTFSSNEAGATFECSMDSAPFAACANGVTYSSLAKGQHSFQVRAIDAAGNVDASPASRNFGIK